MKLLHLLIAGAVGYAGYRAVENKKSKNQLIAESFEEWLSNLSDDNKRAVIYLFRQNEVYLKQKESQFSDMKMIEQFFASIFVMNLSKSLRNDLYSQNQSNVETKVSDMVNSSLRYFGISSSMYYTYNGLLDAK
ncbi:hypothetical protein [Mesoplasma florum]|uniref:hypothetical protein n=1 Tax=Mesoplasma florum TaxID=2151 RepID=UPI000BE3491E|nr:hypothetical protein [Mesoplasma florum]ATI74067.1 hypothetical protein CQZ70_02295 [Mesoplasma florum]